MLCGTLRDVFVKCNHAAIQARNRTPEKWAPPNEWIVGDSESRFDEVFFFFLLMTSFFFFFLLTLIITGGSRKYIETRSTTNPVSVKLPIRSRGCRLLKREPNLRLSFFVGLLLRPTHPRRSRS